MNISIFGMGYVGCVSLGCLASRGHTVVGVDVNPTKINLINSGKPTIIEKEIDRILAQAHRDRLVRATSDARSAVLDSEVSIIAVGTPSTKEGHLNLKHIFRVAEEIGAALREKESFHIIVIRSTVLPGTNRQIGEIVEKASARKRNRDFAVVSNPEFMREGSAVKDYFNPPFTVLGSENRQALDRVEALYRDLNAPVRKVSIEVAELIKYVNNSFHALKIVFANEVGNICKNLGIDSHEVMDLFALDTRLNLSPYYLKPGFAYGGSCLPKDLKGLKTMAHVQYLSAPVLEAIETSNENQKRIAIDLVLKHGKKRVGILGLSFKEGTDDLRYSPMVEVAEHLLGKGYPICIYDKNISLSRLTGTNKEFIDEHIPHLAALIRTDIEEVIGLSEVILLTHRIEEIAGHIEKHPDKIFIDFARVTDRRFPNCEGICW